MKKTNNAQIILSIVTGFLILYLILHKPFLLTIAVVFGVLGLLSDYFSEAVSKVWMKFALILGRINGNILLTLIFFLFLTPIAFLMRIIQRGDALKLKKQTNSVYDERNHLYTSGDLENTW